MQRFFGVYANAQSTFTRKQNLACEVDRNLFANEHNSFMIYILITTFCIKLFVRGESENYQLQIKILVIRSTRKDKVLVGFVENEQSSNHHVRM